MVDNLNPPTPSDDDQTIRITTGAAGGLAPQPARDHSLPQSIGRYKIIRLLGEGGMGAVYQAEQQKPHRIVALKVIKSGFATPDLIRRFEQESQALGRLQHPGIAQIFEAGTAQTNFGPQPFFAMEFIDGLPLIAYADLHRLNSPQRLDLMCKVCEAVHHAHQRGIVHRDLKPANILVDATGQPKILDFGIARVTDSDSYATRQTDVGQLIGTVAYMSPEQVLADPLEIDTRSDVYALGVVFFELMAGRLPYNSNRKLLHEMMQAIREDEPSRLSSVNRLYRGDVEIIAAKALEKDKARRYSSAAGMGADIRRYLNNEPIVARPPTASYQLQKFARRHRALVAGVLVVSVVLIAGSVVSTWEAIRATRAERLARQSETKARSERDRATAAESIATQQRDRAILAEKTATSDRDRAIKAEAQARLDRDRADGEAATAKAISEFLQTDLLAQASTATQTAGSKPDPDIKVRTLLDRAAERVKDRFHEKPQVQAAIQSTIGSAYEGLGLFDESQRHLSESVDLFRSSLGRGHPDTLSATRSLGEVSRSAGKYAQAESLLTEALEGFRRTRGAGGEKTQRAMQSLAGVYIAEGKFTQAEPLLRHLMKTLPTDSPAAMDTMASMARLSFIQGRFSEAERLLSTVISSRRRTLGPEHPSTIGIMNNLAVLYQSQFRNPEAETLYATVLDVDRRVLGPEHPDTLNVMNNLGVLSFFEGNYDRAESLYLKVLDGWRKQLGPEHPRTITLRSNLATLYQIQGKFPEAKSMATEILEARRRVLGPAHPDTLDSLYSLGDLYFSEKNYSAAEPLFVQALDGSRRLLGPENAKTTISLAALGELRLAQGRYSEAESLLSECLTVQKKVKPDDYRTYLTESLLGAAMAAQKRYAEAEPLLLSGYQGLKQRESKMPAHTRRKMDQAAERIVQFYEGQGRTDEAAKWRDRGKP